MKKLITILSITATMFVLASCHNGENDFDAAGSFESVETIVSSQATGTLMQFNVEEGQTLKPGQMVGYVDSTQLYLKKRQLEAQIASTKSQMPDIPVQLASLKAQLEDAQKNQQRIQNMFKSNAATQQQLDNANTQVDVLKKQIDAQQSILGDKTNTLSKSVVVLQRQIDQLNDQLSKCRIINPIHGTVLTKYVEDHEVVMPGKALYDIAETDTLDLRAYVSGSQLDEVKLGQKVTVRVDNGPEKYREYPGTIYWISSKSEFTPKTIPTKDERADLVYAVKVRVVNKDGFLKIGMYGEMKLK